MSAPAGAENFSLATSSHSTCYLPLSLVSALPVVCSGILLWFDVHLPEAQVLNAFSCADWCLCIFFGDVAVGPFAQFLVVSFVFSALSHEGLSRIAAASHSPVIHTWSPSALFRGVPALQRVAVLTIPTCGPVPEGCWHCRHPGVSPITSPAVTDVANAHRALPCPAGDHNQETVGALLPRGLVNLHSMSRQEANVTHAFTF